MTTLFSKDWLPSLTSNLLKGDQLLTTQRSRLKLPLVTWRGIAKRWLIDSRLVGREVSRGEKMALRGTDPESYITEHTSAYEDQIPLSTVCISTAAAPAAAPLIPPALNQRSSRRAARLPPRSPPAIKSTNSRHGQKPSRQSKREDSRQKMPAFVLEPTGIRRPAVHIKAPAKDGLIRGSVRQRVLP